MKYIYYYNLNRKSINTQNMELQIILKLVSKGTLEYKTQN